MIDRAEETSATDGGSRRMNRDEMSVGTERMESARVGDQLGGKRKTITVDLRETDEAIQALHSSLLFSFLTTRRRIDRQHDHNTHSHTHTKKRLTHTQL